MFIDFLVDSFVNNANKDAIVWQEQTFSYGWLAERLSYWQQWMTAQQIPAGAVVMIDADFSPNSVALLLALVEHRCTVVPITESVAHKKTEYIEVSESEYVIDLDAEDNVVVQATGIAAKHPMLVQLKQDRVPGLVLFSSGTTGKSKAAVHDFAKLLEKFKLPRHSLRSVSFLLYDHIGGVNTLLYTLANAGCVVTLQNRNPDYVLKQIDKFGVQLLPTSPSFINLVLISEAYKNYQLKSLQTVTYGTEPMPESTLTRFHQLFPHIRMQQTYGLSEVGILRTKSKDSSSLWMRVGGEGFDTRIVNGILEIKAESAMKGYLNAKAPFTEDGWFHTGDMVEVDGDYIRILGRRSEIINVGGQKVFPCEVESVVQQHCAVAEVEAYGEDNLLLGKTVAVKVRLQPGCSPDLQQKKEIKAFCRGKLEKFMQPTRIVFDNATQASARFKKQRTLS